MTKLSFKWALKILSLTFAILLLQACADDAPIYVERPVEELYNEAMDFLELEEYRKAAASFEEVDRQHPYSVWATKAQLMGAYVYYRRGSYDDAILGLDRFIDLHPGNPDTPYAYYLRAISYYEQIVDVGRDQKITQLARDSLQEIVRRYPNSRYARDATLKIDLTHDHLAGKEMNIGRFYQVRGEYLAAINRYRQVVEKYQTTSHVAEALSRLVECYLSMGISDEAQMAGAVLGHNFTGSKWYEHAYNLLNDNGLEAYRNEGSWLDKMWNWIF
jgi:outer membrane protein assembly factor BamD